LKRKKLAIILSRFPYPIDKGDKLRAYHQIISLSQHFDIHLFALYEKIPSESDFNTVKQYCTSIELYHLNRLTIAIQSGLSFLKKLPVQVGYFFSKKHKIKIQEAITSLKPDTIYCQLSRTALYAYDLPFYKVIDFQDAFAMNYNRIQENAYGLKKWFYKRESNRMKSFERQMLQWFDATTIISSFDKANLSVQPNQTVVIGNGVDYTFFSPQNIAKKYDLLFLGNLSYLPNQNAVRFLIDEVIPKLLLQRPQLTINIAGASMPSSYKAYNSPNITMSGWVEDIRNTYAEAKLFVAPLITGAGVQNKLLEAMSMALPCVTTSVVNASLQAVEGKQLIIANTCDEFVVQILNLLDNQEKQNRLSKEARRFIEESYSWEKSNAKLAQVLNRQVI
jgi:sugar transferase (PEP-CTERM/EpsH1 system associated)